MKVNPTQKSTSPNLESKNSLKNVTRKLKIDQKLESLKEIELPKKIPLFNDFIIFIKKYGVLGLSLGIVIGSAIKSLVDSLTNDIINPVLGKIMGRVELNNWVFYDISIGKFITQIINFTILLFIVFVAIKLFLSRFMSDEEKQNLKLM